MQIDELNSAFCNLHSAFTIGATGLEPVTYGFADRYSNSN
jgi:hypothetical protein